MFGRGAARRHRHVAFAADAADREIRVEKSAPAVEETLERPGHLAEVDGRGEDEEVGGEDRRDGREAGIALYSGRDATAGDREGIVSLYGRIDRRRFQITAEAVADHGPSGKYSWYLQPQYKLSERTRFTLRGETRRLDCRVADSVSRKLLLAHARQFNENLLLKTEVSRRVEDDPSLRDTTGFLSSLSVIF